MVQTLHKYQAMSLLALLLLKQFNSKALYESNRKETEPLCKRHLSYFIKLPAPTGSFGRIWSQKWLTQLQNLVSEGTKDRSKLPISCGKTSSRIFNHITTPQAIRGNLIKLYHGHGVIVFQAD